VSLVTCALPVLRDIWGCRDSSSDIHGSVKGACCSHHRCSDSGLTGVVLGIGGIPPTNWECGGLDLKSVSKVHAKISVVVFHEDEPSITGVYMVVCVCVGVGVELSGEEVFLLVLYPILG
jgi:hypothetical protein